MNFDNSAVDCILRFHPTKGFSSYHFQWPVGILDEIDRGNRYSCDFAKCYEFAGHMIVRKIDKTLEIELHRHAPKAAKRLAVILRFAVSTESNDTVLFSDSYRCFAFKQNHFDGFPLVRMNMEKFDSSDDLIVHCWMDVPIINESSKKRRWDDDYVDDSGPTRGFEKLSTDFFDLFKGVCGSDDLFSSFSDVIVKISDRKFYCHRNVLAARSSVFLRMFANKEWKEGGDGGERIVEIEDIDENTMEIVLGYIYRGGIPEKEDKDGLAEYFGKIIYAADKYNLQELKEWCMVQLILLEEKTDADIIDQFGLAEMYQLPALKATCVASLSSDVSFLKNEEMRKKIPEELLTAVLTDATRRRFRTTEIRVTE